MTSAYPQYRARADRTISLEDRINDCFDRSLNGSPLALGSAEMSAFVAYMTWLSTSVPRGAEVAGRAFAKLQRPVDDDNVQGKRSYEA